MCSEGSIYPLQEVNQAQVSLSGALVLKIRRFGFFCSSPVAAVVVMGVEVGDKEAANLLDWSGAHNRWQLV